MNFIFAKITPTELRRRLLHIALGPVLVFGVYTGWLTSWLLFWVLAVGVLLSFVVRHARVPIIGWFLDNFDRRSEDFPGRGVITYFIGCILALQLFPQDVALAAILILALGDGISGLIGPFGRLKTHLSNIKLLEGTLAGVIAGAVAASFFVSPIEAGAAAAAAMIFEAMEIRLNQKILDDNVIVPLAAGTAIMLLRSSGLL